MPQQVRLLVIAYIRFVCITQFRCKLMIRWSPLPFYSRFPKASAYVMTSPFVFGNRSFRLLMVFRIIFFCDDWWTVVIQYVYSRMCLSLSKCSTLLFYNIFRYEYIFDRVAIPLRGLCFRIPVFSLHSIKLSVLFMYYSVFPSSCSHLLCCSHATRSWSNAWGYDCESAALTPMARANHPNTKTYKPKLGKAIRSGHRTQELTGRMERGGVHNTQDIILYNCFEMYVIHR